MKQQDMTDEELNRAIHKALNLCVHIEDQSHTMQGEYGFKSKCSECGDTFFWNYEQDFTSNVPDYSTDLNAISKVEDGFDKTQQYKYVCMLDRYLGGTASWFQHETASARHRAEAALTVLKGVK